MFKEYPLEIKIIFFVCVILAVVSLAGMDSRIESPADWLLDWTTWVASVVGIVVSARVLWVGGDAFRKYLDR